MSVPASRDRIAAWWRRWPQANVGIVTGSVSAVAVVDVDPRAGGDASLRDLEGRHAVLPITPEVRTGGGGRHLWFRSEPGTPSIVLRPGVELKGDGGMVVVPPSLHVSGAHYVWRPGGNPDELAFASLPSWLLELASGPLDGSATPIDDVSVRTSAEQAEFAEAWERAGIALSPGDRYYLCPFHADHHPSLHIDAEGCRWYCFGCAMGGGIGRLLRVLGEHRQPAPRSRLRTRQGRGRPITLLGRREVEAVGESHHQDELLELTGGHRRHGGVEVEVVAELVPEPSNRFDPDAVAVRIEDHTVGYVRHEDARWLHGLIDESLDLHGFATCGAVIQGGWDRGRGDVGWFGVTLLVPNPPD